MATVRQQLSTIGKVFWGAIYIPKIRFILALYYLLRSVPMALSIQEGSASGATIIDTFLVNLGFPEFTTVWIFVLGAILLLTSENPRLYVWAGFIIFFYALGLALGAVFDVRMSGRGVGVAMVTLDTTFLGLLAMVSMRVQYFERVQAKLNSIVLENTRNGKTITKAIMERASKHEAMPSGQVKHLATLATQNEARRDEMYKLLEQLPELEHENDTATTGVN